MIVPLTCDDGVENGAAQMEGGSVIVQRVCTILQMGPTSLATLRAMRIYAAWKKLAIWPS
jgi:hypothetical protein